MKFRFALLSTILLTSAYLFVFYNKVIQSPNEYFFSTRVDGLANYYNFAWHIKHDSDYAHFQGWNHPFGEYLHYVDCSPALSNIIKFISNNVVDISSYSIGILNVLIILSIVIGAGFLFLILQHFGIPYLGSVLGAAGIALMSSQVVLLIPGHFALSLACFFPIGWYLLLKFFDRQHPWLWSGLIALNTLFWTYIHIYSGMMLILFTSITLIIHRGRSLRTYGFFFVQVVLPLLFVLGMALIFDSHQGRMEFPFVTAYRSSGWTILYPYHSTLKPVFDWILSIIHLYPPDPEKHLWLPFGNYIGLSTITILSGSLVYWFKHKQIRQVFHHDLSPFVIASLIILLYSMAIPFRWTSALTDYFPFFNQFIALGRFAWVFYYVAAVLSLVLLPQIFPAKSAHGLIVAAGLLLLFESLGYHQKMGKLISTTPNMFAYDQSENSGLFSIETKHINFDSFQAIIPLPYYNKTNTPFAFESSLRSEQLSTRLSYYSGIPLMSANTARPSIREGTTIIQIFSPNPSAQDAIKKTLPSTKPLLVIWSKEKLLDVEDTILGKAHQILDHPVYALYELSLDDLFRFDTLALKTEFEHAFSFGNPKARSDHFSTDSSQFFYFNDFENLPNDLSYRGHGAFEEKKNKSFKLLTAIPGSFQPGIKYTVSFWFYNKLNQHTYCRIWLEELAPNGQIINSIMHKPFASTIFDNHWAFNSYTFEVADERNAIHLRFQGQNLLDNRVIIDDLMIRPTIINTYKVFVAPDGKQHYVKNNQTILVE